MLITAYTDACTLSCKIGVASKRPLILFLWLLHVTWERPLTKEY